MRAELRAPVHGSGAIPYTPAVTMKMGPHTQRGMRVFLAESRDRSSKDGTTSGSLIDCESQKIKETVLSTTVAEMCYFMKCFGSCQLLRGLWMDTSGEVANIHMRTDAKDLEITATTIH